jgi:hypothetical protein
MPENINNPALPRAVLRYLSAERAIARLFKIFYHHITQEQFAEYLMARRKDWQAAEEAGFVGQFLVDVGDLTRDEADNRYPRCLVCNADIERPDTPPRSHARYCSSACRQKAYRTRHRASGNQ